MQEKKSQNATWVWSLGALLAVVLIVGGEILWGGRCVRVLPFFPVDGSQGYRLWYGETLISFKHEERTICIPRGWEAVGATWHSHNRARFEKDKTGVMIKKDSFASKLLLLPNSSYEVRLVFPLEIPRDHVFAYERIATHAFENVGGLYGDSPTKEKTPHTVLVTSGLAGNTRGEGTRVYPDPTEYRSFIVRTPEQPRSEELFIHAVAHLYNRFRSVDDEYLEHQAPFSPGDFQELEATWSELAYASPGARHERTSYLYNIHTALRGNDFSRLTKPPFTNPAALSRIRQTAIVAPGSSYLDYQYGHYVLSPLAMLALEGMLAETSASTTVESLLREARERKTSLVSLIDAVLSPNEAKKFMGWIQGEETIPQYFITAGKERYDNEVFGGQ